VFASVPAWMRDYVHACLRSLCLSAGVLACLHADEIACKRFTVQALLLGGVLECWRDCVLVSRRASVLACLRAAYLHVCVREFNRANVQPCMSSCVLTFLNAGVLECKHARVIACSRA
jgi:hypothetical protein